MCEPPKYGIKPFGEEESNDGYISQIMTEGALFSVYRYKVSHCVKLSTDENSFNHILVIGGEGAINGRTAKKGDSYFVPASFGEYEISGKIEFLLTKI